MEEIRIYHSFWGRLILSISFIAFFGTMIWFFAVEEDLRDADAMIIFAFIIFCIYALFGFFLMFNSIVEKVCHRPFMVISDKGIAVNGLLKKKYIDFADVSCFDLRQTSFLQNSLLVFYNPEGSKKKLEGLNIILRLLRQKIIYQEGIDISFIDMKAGELCTLLNERLSQIPSPDIEEEPQVLEDESVPTDETSMRETEELSVDTEVRHATVFHAFFYMLLSSVIIAALWGLIRWGWLECGWLPQTKGYVPKWVIPGILTAVFSLLCRNFFRTIGEYAWVILILPYILFVNTGNMVERMSLDVPEIQSITPEMEPTLANADYIYVAKMSVADLDTMRGNYHFGVSTRDRPNNRRDIVFHLYGVYPLRAIPNVYIADETTESHDYTNASKKALEEKYEHFMEHEEGFLLRRKMNCSYLKRLLPSDNIEGYQNALEEILKKEGKAFDSEKIIIYEFNSGIMARSSANYYRNICLSILFFEVVVLFFACVIFFKEDKYKQTVISSRKFENSILHTTPDKILVYSLPVLMVVIFLLMLLNGYSLNTTNKEMLMRWGAIEKNAVFEEHEWWRLLTYGFLHNGFMHLFGNMILLVVSVFMMRLTHNGYRITFVFLVSTLFSGIFILLFGSGYCVGASGGVFGVMSFWLSYELYTAYKDKDHETSPTVRFPLVMILMNLIFSFGNGISMSGHLGGLVAGIILAIIIGAKDKSHKEKISV